MNQECFVIQPISDTKFTKRYDDIYKPAIEATGLKAYRVDLDPTVKIPIEEIESRIKDSVICIISCRIIVISAHTINCRIIKLLF